MKSVFCFAVLALGCSPAGAAVLQAVTEELPASSGKNITVTAQPARGGQAAFRHVTQSGAEASEIITAPGAIGREQWYGWSLQLPADFDHRDRSTVLMQLTAATSEPIAKLACGLGASALEINAKGQAVFHLHLPAAGGGHRCVEHPLSPDVTPAKGKWVDVVMRAKWTNAEDGFVDLWVKVHDNNFFHLVQYNGRTWGSAERGPEFRIGVRVAGAAAKGDVVVLTDELRLGDASSSFDEVAPPGAETRAKEAGRGQTRYVLYESKVNRRDIPVLVYTPPGYDPKGERRYPVVYNLHGAGGGSSERQWLRVHGTLVQAMDSGAVPLTIYVFVNGQGDTGFVDHPESGPKVFSSIVTELIPFIDANYRTIADRRGRGVDGFSMGGGGSIMLATKRPDLFSAVVAYAGGFIPHHPDEPNQRKRKMMEDFSPYALVRRQADLIRTDLRIRLVCGDQDQLHAPNLQFKAFLEGLKIPVSWVSIGGVGHDTKGLFDRVGVESLKFMHEGFGKTGNRKPDTGN